MMSEDRRSLTLRLSSLQYIVTVLFTVLAVAFWVLQVAQHPAREFQQAEILNDHDYQSPAG